MLSRRVAAAGAVLGAAVIAALTWQIDRLIDSGPPPPDRHEPIRGVTVERPEACGPAKDDNALKALRDFSLFLPHGGGDTVILGNSFHGIIFDSASPTELDTHDRLILRGRLPEETRFIRVGPHLLICGEDPRSEILWLRHYCHGTHDGEPWNNSIEEIKFPEAREIWLRDDLLDELLSAPNTRSAGTEEFEDPLIWITELSLSRWTLRPFSEALPGDWLSSVQCRLDGRRRLSPE